MPANRLARRWANRRSPCRPSQSPSVTALPEGEPSRGRRPRRPTVQGHGFLLVVSLRGAKRRGNPFLTRPVSMGKTDSHVGPAGLLGMTYQEECRCTVGRESPKRLQPSQSPSVTALPEGEPSRARCPQRAALTRQARDGGQFPIQSVIFRRNNTKCSASGHQNPCPAGPGRSIFAPPWADLGRLGQILRKLWQSVHWSMEG